MATIPLDELGPTILAMERQIDDGLAQGLTQGLKKALRLSITKFMQGGGKHAPVNPPPGPLRIRTGNLRRSVAVVPAKVKSGRIVEGGLKAGSSRVAYAGVHELGGGRIPARPYLQPALEAAEKDIIREAGKGAARAMARFFDVT